MGSKYLRYAVQMFMPTELGLGARNDTEGRVGKFRQLVKRF